MPQKTVELEHGIIFVYDLETSNFEVPEYTEGKPVSSNGQCVSIIGLSYVDGETTITIENKVNQPLKHLVFDGRINCPSKRVSVCVAGDHEMLSIQTKSADIFLRVWINDLKFPDKILIEAK